MKQSNWHNCYNQQWKNVITPESFTHPAKFARGLIERIYSHIIKQGYARPGDVVLDPFGGVATSALFAMQRGFDWVGVELEQRFVDLGQANIDKWNKEFGRYHFSKWGTAELLQGDSRQLFNVIKGVELVVSSPPYKDTIRAGHDGPGARHDKIHHNGANSFKNSSSSEYGRTPGQLAVSMDFWGDSRQVIMQCYDLLSPAGVVVWVTKDFVRDGKRVSFSDQWQALCEGCGLVAVERVKSWLVLDGGTQLGLLGQPNQRMLKAWKSWGRRTAEKNGAEPIDWEDVIIMRKQG